MQRYFVAISLPDETRDRLLAVQPSSIPGLRRIGRQEFHLTLHFLGNLTADSKEAVLRGLETVTMNSFSIAIRGLGAFPTLRSPKVLWCGVEGEPALLALHQAVGSALSKAIGFQIEERPYSPHITLARINGRIPRDFIENYLIQHQGFHIPSIPVKCFALYSSHQIDGIPQYREEAVIDLL